MILKTNETFLTSLQLPLVWPKAVQFHPETKKKSNTNNNYTMIAKDCRYETYF